MKNRPKDLNNHLFEAMERLNDETLTDEALKNEIERAKGICAVSNQIVSNHRIALDAVKVAHEVGITVRNPPVLGLLAGPEDEPRGGVDDA